jgi:transcriptional regulator with XRE-family HTH domain
MKEPAAAVVAVLRRARSQRGWSLDELGTRTGITTQRLAALESGAVELTLADLYQVCAALDLDPAAVVTEALGR